MALLIIVILIIAAVTGTLWTVLEIAAGVAVGIFLAAVLLTVAVYYLVRSKIRQAQRDWESRRGGGPPDRRA